MTRPRTTFHASLPKTKFAADSPLEGDGFEPSVPHKKQPFLAAPFGPAIRLPQQKPALSCRGPMVRIHLPPAASLSRECLPCLQAQRPGFRPECVSLDVTRERDVLATSRLALAAFL